MANEKYKNGKKISCPECFNNAYMDIVRLRPNFYWCRRCGAEFEAEHQGKGHKKHEIDFE